MSELFKQASIAKYISELLKKDKNHESRILALERKKQDGRAPAVPAAGQVIAFDPQRYEVVKVTTIVADTVFGGQRCEPSAENKWIPDEDLEMILVDVPVGHSCPDVGDEVLAVFVGTYLENGTEKGRYGSFPLGSECRIGITCANSFTYPTSPANVYEVQTYRGSFTQIPGNQTINKNSWEVVIAASWDDNVILIPEGTKIIVHPHNNHWWFNQPTYCESVCYTSCSSAISLVEISTP